MSKITRRQWLIGASIIAGVIVTIYVIIHAVFSDSLGEKTHTLSTTEFAAITSIVQSSQSTAPVSTEQSGTASPTDSLQPGDSLQSANSMQQNLAQPLVGTAPCDCDTITKQRVKDYLHNIMELKYTATVDSMIDAQGVENITYISNYPFRVKSYFWLSDYWVLLEVIFWSLFGLIANLMYSVTRAHEEDVDGDGLPDKPEKFDPNRIPEHFGKLWYTPITSVVLYLSIDYLTASGEVHETPDGAFVVIFAFLLGFFTRRTIALLRKLKDIFFPNDNNGSEDSGQNQGAPPPPPPTTFTDVTLSGTVTADPSLGITAFTGTVVNIYAASDGTTVVQTVTLTEEMGGSFTFEQPFTPGDFTYDASLTSGGYEYTDNGSLTILDTSDTQSFEVTLSGSAG